MITQFFGLQREPFERDIPVDELVHELDPATLAAIRYLTNFRAESFSPISLWLVG